MGIFECSVKLIWVLEECDQRILSFVQLWVKRAASAKLTAFSVLTNEYFHNESYIVHLQSPLISTKIGIQLISKANWIPHSSVCHFNETISSIQCKSELSDCLTDQRKTNGKNRTNKTLSKRPFNAIKAA